jgi:hypothetical protein
MLMKDGLQSPKTKSLDAQIAVAESTAKEASTRANEVAQQAALAREALTAAEREYDADPQNAKAGKVLADARIRSENEAGRAQRARAANEAAEGALAVLRSERAAEVARLEHAAALEAARTELTKRLEEARAAELAVRRAEQTANRASLPVALPVAIETAVDTARALEEARAASEHADVVCALAHDRIAALDPSYGAELAKRRAVKEEQAAKLAQEGLATSASVKGLRRSLEPAVDLLKTAKAIKLIAEQMIASACAAHRVATAKVETAPGYKSVEALEGVLLLVMKRQAGLIPEPRPTGSVVVLTAPTEEDAFYAWAAEALVNVPHQAPITRREIVDLVLADKAPLVTKTVVERNLAALSEAVSSESDPVKRVSHARRELRYSIEHRTWIHDGREAQLCSFIRDGYQALEKWRALPENKHAGAYKGADGIAFMQVPSYKNTANVLDLDADLLARVGLDTRAAPSKAMADESAA